MAIHVYMYRCTYIHVCVGGGAGAWDTWDKFLKVLNILTYIQYMHWGTEF